MLRINTPHTNTSSSPMPTVDEHDAVEPVAPVEEVFVTEATACTTVAEAVKENVAGEAIPLKRSSLWRRFLSCFFTK